MVLSPARRPARACASRRGSAPSRGSVSRVDVRHRRRDGRVDRGDLGVHLVRDGAVARVALAARAELDQLHRLAGVEVEDEADPVAEAQRVRRRRREAATAETLVLVAESSSARRYSSPQPASSTCSGTPAPSSGAERLPLDRQHPVALEIPEGAVVGDDLEPVAQCLEPATRAGGGGWRARRRGRRAAPPARRPRAGRRLPRSPPPSRAASNSSAASSSSSSPSTRSRRTDGPARSLVARPGRGARPSARRRGRGTRGGRSTRRRDPVARRGRRSSASPP